MPEENYEEKDKKSTKKIILTILILVCVGIVIFSVYKIVSTQMNYKKAQNEYSSLRGYTTPADTSNENSNDTDADSFDEEQGSKTHGQEVQSRKQQKAPITVDHEALLAQNPDYVGWLYIGALNVSYPIMKGEDDEYYLHRTFEKSYLFAGSLFINSEASRDFSDPHTLIYGHNMKDGSMFGTLRKLADESLYVSDPYFWVLTPYGDFRYRIFSMYTCLDTADTYTLFSGHGEIVVDYIDAMKAKSAVDCGSISYDENSKVVTLSTCVHAEGRERFVVQGVTESN